MPDPITWGNLAKTVSDLKTIVEEVQDQILTHNQDDSAHGQSDESLYNHRIAELLDHVDESISNSKLFPVARVYKKIIDPSGNGDYDSIDDFGASGDGETGGAFFFAEGVHVPSDEFVVGDNFVMVGAGPGVTIIKPSTNWNFIFENLTNLEFRDLTFDLNGKVPGDSGFLFFNGCTNVRFVNCEFKGLNSSTKSLVSLWDCSGYLFDRCYFNQATSDAGRGIYIGYPTGTGGKISHDGIITHCTFAGLDYAIHVVETAGLSRDPAFDTLIIGNLFGRNRAGSNVVQDVNAIRIEHAGVASANFVETFAIVGNYLRSSGARSVVYYNGLQRSSFVSNHVIGDSTSGSIGLYIANGTQHVIGTNTFESLQIGIRLADSECVLNVCSGNMYSTSSVGVYDSGSENKHEFTALCCEAFRANTQSIANGVYVTVSFDTQAYDPFNVFSVADPTKIYVYETGFYLVTFRVNWQLHAGGVRILRVDVSGTEAHHVQTHLPLSYNHSVDTSCILYLFKGQYLQFKVWQSSGGPINISASGIPSRATKASVVKLRI